MLICNFSNQQKVNILKQNQEEKKDEQIVYLDTNNSIYLHTHTYNAQSTFIEKEMIRRIKENIKFTKCKI